MVRGRGCCLHLEALNQEEAKRAAPLAHPWSTKDAAAIWGLPRNTAPCLVVLGRLCNGPQWSDLLFLLQFSLRSLHFALPEPLRPSLCQGWPWGVTWAGALFPTPLVHGLVTSPATHQAAFLPIPTEGEQTLVCVFLAASNEDWR